MLAPTPLLQAPLGLFAAPQRPWLKMDALQPSGSFKMRGISHLLRERAAADARSVVCASGGNAGFTAARVATDLGLPITVIVPGSTAPNVQAAIRALGATLEVHGASWDEAYERACTIAAETGAVNVHPFDDPLVWDGHASLIDEVVAAGVTFDCVIAGCGGGGLLAGIVAGLDRHGLAQVPVFAVETLGADSLAQSLAAGQLVTLPAIRSVATSLGARRVAPRAFELAQAGRLHSVCVSDAQAVAACLRFADAMRVLVEPACGAALAALDAHPAVFAGFQSPLIEVCGGIGVSLQRLQDWRTQFQIA